MNQINVGYIENETTKTELPSGAWGVNHILLLFFGANIGNNAGKFNSMVYEKQTHANNYLLLPLQMPLVGEAIILFYGETGYVFHGRKSA